jgi:N-acetylglucosaminyldiphosphoundecaprenol N-acetyl-beta-D-mannosaminyltransferase
MKPLRHRVAVIATRVDVVGWDAAIERIARWGRERQSRYVCFSNVHSAVTAAFDPDFAQVINDSDLCTSDGAPITWMLRQLGAEDQPRLNGPDLMWRYLEHEAPRGAKVFLYGSTGHTLALLGARIQSQFPSVELSGVHAPPFRELTPEEDEEIVRRINDSGAHVVFVCLGCPKQETWMAAHKGRIRSVMVGVGAAFDFHAGVKARAPQWMRNAGLEWLHRLWNEPRRLWRRYLFTNLAFLVLAGVQWAASRLRGLRPARPMAAGSVPLAGPSSGQAGMRSPGSLTGPTHIPLVDG